MELKPRDHVRAGGEHLARREFKKAVQAFRAALVAAPEDLDAREGLGVALSGAGEYAAALEELDRVLKKAPDRAVAQRARYETLMRLGRFEDGIDGLRRAMNQDDGK